MNHSRSTGISAFSKWRRAITLAVSAGLFIFSCHSGLARFYRWNFDNVNWESDQIHPHALIKLGGDVNKFPPGSYRIHVLIDGEFEGEIIAFSVNENRSVTITDDFGSGVRILAFANITKTCSAKPQLYNGSTSNPKIVGSVSGSASFSFHEVNYDEFDLFHESIEFTVSVYDCVEFGAGDAEGHLNSVHYDIGLGMGTNAIGTGRLSLHRDLIHPDLAKPDSLILYSSSDFKEIRINNQRQVLSGHLLADIVTNNAYQYEVRLYRSSDAGTTNGSGLYEPATSNAVKIITFKNPDGVTNYNRLWITEVDLGPAPTTNQYQYTCLTNSSSTSNTWELLYPSNLRKDVVTTTWSTDLTERTNLFSVYTPGSPDVLAYQERKRFKDFGWGERLIEQVIDPAGAALTNTWEYYTTPSATGDYSRLKGRTEWNGYWEQYDYDTQGRETNRTTVFLNAAYGSGASQCRVVTNSYSSSPPHVTTVESLLGHEIGRTYLAFYSGSNAVKTVQCQTAGASWTAADNLVSIVAQDNVPLRATNILHANGTRTFYSYVTNADFSMTTTVGRGEPNSDGKTLKEGTRTITEIGPYGETISNIVINVTGSTDGIIVLKDTYTYGNDDWAKRSPTITHLDGTQTSGGAAGCCDSPNIGNGLDKDGTEISYVYDALKRRASSTVNSVTISNIFDPLGNQVVSMRIGTDSSVITNRQATYDLAGRLISATDALGAVTTVTNAIGAEGQLIKTNTYADGSTRIETYFRDGSLESVTGTAVFPVRYRYAVGDDGEGLTNTYTTETKLGASGSDTNEWVKTFQDMIGRNYKTVYASSTTNFPFLKLRYNNLGQLTNQVDPDGISVLYTYNPKGELACSVADSNRNFTIQYSGDDRITYVTNDVVNNGTADVRRTRTYVWNTSADSSNLVSTVETSADGLRSWNTVWNNGVGVTSQSRTVYDAANGYRYVTNSAPDGSYTIFTTRYGTNVSLIQCDSANSQLSATTFAYDSHGRLNKFTDARNGTTTNYFNNADQVSGMATPAPAPGQSSQVASNFFDIRGRISGSILPDNTSVTNEYFLTGLLKKTSGSRTYPVEYTYDYAGRMKTMQTWTNFPNNNTATTTWTYDVYRGFLNGKTYDGGAAGPSYTYTDAGRLETRTWARGVETVNTYNDLGELQEVSYSDGTPGVTYSYNRLGQLLTVTRDSSVCTYAYNDVGLLLSDSTTGGILDGLSVTNGYDSFLRRTNLVLNSASGRLTFTTNDFDSASRLHRISDGTNSATYSYLANSPLVSQVVFSNSTALRLTTTKAYDFLNRLTNITSTPSGSSAVSFKYGYNSANQRTTVTNADNSRWVYAYDSLGQVTSGKKYWSDGTAVAGQQFEYGFDTIGNRKTAKAGGDAAGANLRTANYSANGLNHYTGRTVPGAADILGSADSSATVTVNNRATYRKGEYYRLELNLDNSSSAVWSSVTNVAVLNNGTNADIVTTAIGSIFLAQTNEVFAYDADGNMTSDGRWTYMWDAENQLTNMTSLSSNPSGSKLKLDFAYDGYGRRTLKIISSWDGTNYVDQSTNRFVYDGWNLIAILNPDFSSAATFMWGLDLSDTLQGAGGVGGLLSIRDQTNGTHFASFDENGNLAALTRASDGTLSGIYEYGPFGEMVRSTGPMAGANPFRFSTKFQDNESDLLFYGYRFCDPHNGGWLNRDPVGELGGQNLYALSSNDPVDFFDFLGLKDHNNVAPFYLIPSQLHIKPTVPGAGRPPGSGLIYMKLSNGRDITIITPPEPDDRSQSMENGGMIVGIFVEPVDWVMTGKQICKEPKNPWSYAGLIPFVPSGTTKLAKKIEINPKKFDYLFGNVAPDAHNTARSLQNAAQLNRIGIQNTTEGVQILTEHLDSAVQGSGNIVNTFTKTLPDGSLINLQTRESLIAGPGGFLKLESTWEVMPDGTLRFTTAIPIGGN
jgi:RHS repeat-associated protein